MASLIELIIASEEPQSSWTVNVVAAGNFSRPEVEIMT